MGDSVDFGSTAGVDFGSTASKTEVMALANSRLSLGGSTALPTVIMEDAPVDPSAVATQEQLIREKGVADATKKREQKVAEARTRASQQRGIRLAKGASEDCLALMKRLKAQKEAQGAAES